MATSNEVKGITVISTGPERDWKIFALAAFSAICLRKHDLAVPHFDAQNVSDDELDRRIRLLSELAHLPPA